MSTGKSFGTKMGDWFRNILSCCDSDEEEERPALQISGPTNFRREDISIPGLDPEQQRFIREKAISDATKMWDHLQPLRSSPSGQFVNRNDLPSYEDFITSRSTPTPAPTSTATGRASMTSARRPSASQPSPLDRIKAHSRKISNSLSKPLGYQSVGKAEGSPYEMRALMDPSRTQIPVGKMSGESYSVAGSEEDKDSAKAGIGRL